MITYPVPPNSLWAIYQISSDSIISRNKPWPRADRQEIIGLNPDLILLQQISSPKPEFDENIYTLHNNESIVLSANELRTNWYTRKKTQSELLNLIKDTEATQIQSIGQINRTLLDTVLIVSAILTYSNINFPAKIQPMLDNYRNLGIQLWKNRDNFQTLKQQILSGADPNLTTGWQSLSVQPLSA